MGYSTNFKGTLTFASEPAVAQIARLNEILGEDCREHPDWGVPAAGLYYIDLELTKDFKGIKWSGAEKTYGMTECVNCITALMRREWPEFRFEGTLLAQGEEIDDRWRLVIDEAGNATKQDLQPSGKKVTCPHCDESFYVE